MTYFHNIHLLNQGDNILQYKIIDYIWKLLCMVEYDFKLLRGNVMLGICVGTKSDLVPTCTALLSAINAYWRKFLPVSVSLKSAEGCVKCVSP